MRAIRGPMFHLERGCARGRQSFLGLLGVVGERVKQCPGDMGTSGQHGACIHKYNRCFEVFVFPVVYLDVQRWSNAASDCANGA